VDYEQRRWILLGLAAFFIGLAIGIVLITPGASF
jgi:hypothetical protein